MATQFASVPPSVAALPFLFARPQVDDDWNCRLALFAATAAERADETRRNTPGRIAYLLCELAFQASRRQIDKGAVLPLSRGDIADALGVSLCRVKRTLALLSMSAVIESDGRSIRVLDWPRLCAAAGYAPDRLELTAAPDAIDSAGPGEPADEPRPLTRSGDPACFV